MSEVLVVVRVRAKEGLEADVERVLRRGIAQTHELDQGSVLCAMHRGIDDPRTFVILDKFVSAEALAVHRELPYAKATIAELDELLESVEEALVEPLAVGDPTKGSI